MQCLEPHFDDRVEKRVLDKELSPLQLVGNVFESLRIFSKYGITAKAVACDFFPGPILSSWTALVPFLAVRRRCLDAPALWENFEFLAVLCEDLGMRHPDGLSQVVAANSHRRTKSIAAAAILNKEQQSRSSAAGGFIPLERR
jgi:hypothetical protein